MQFAVEQEISTANKTTLQRVLYFLCYYLIVGVLVFSGISKIINPLPTIETLKAAFKFSNEINLIAATMLPVIEVALALMLLFKYKQRIVLITINVLFFFFFLFAIYGTAIGLNVECGCFSSVVSSEFGIKMILRNLILTSIAFWLVFENKKFASARR